MGLAIHNKLETGFNSYTAALGKSAANIAATASTVEVGNDLNVDASNGNSLRSYAEALVNYDKVTAEFNELSFSSRAFVQNYSSAA
jgi:hypothetical protein